MTKGLHKNSLRKGDNPHQWMIDDARMELIQQIKTKIEQRIKDLEVQEKEFLEQDCHTFVEEARVRIRELQYFLSVLDTLQEPIDKWSNKERNARVKKTGEIVCGFTDGQGHFDIPTDHNEFIRYNLDELEFVTLQEQPVKDNALFNSCLAKVNPETREEVRNNIDKMIEQPVELDNKTIMEEIRKLGCYPSEFDVARRFYEPGRQSKQEVSEGLEEEISNYIEKHFGEPWDGCVPIGCFELDEMARHFAEWGAEHLATPAK